MDTKSRLEEFIQALYDAGWTAPCDAQWENIKAVYEDYCTDLTQCQEAERLREALKPMINGTYYITSEDIERAREALKDKQ